MARRPVPGSQTRIVNEAQAEINAVMDIPEGYKREFRKKLIKLEEILKELEDLDMKILALMLDENVTEADYELESVAIE